MASFVASRDPMLFSSATDLECDSPSECLLLSFSIEVE